jgi:outer membrane biosynthesis protein TonB
VNFWRENPVFRGIAYALGAVALIAFFVMRHPSAPRAAADNERPAVAVSTSPVTEPVVSSHVNSIEILARCQPELKETPSVPNFVIGENYNRAGVQLKVRFVVDNNGFVMNAYVTGASVVSPADQEAGLDYVRHLTFEAPAAGECQTIKMQMVGNFHMSKDSGDDWTTIFDVHPVYSFNGNRVAVNPN